MCRLTFEQFLAENDPRERASYDYESGTLTLHLPKMTEVLTFCQFILTQNHALSICHSLLCVSLIFILQGEFFNNLDMLTVLMEKKRATQNPLIQVINKTGET